MLLLNYFDTTMNIFKSVPYRLNKSFFPFCFVVHLPFGGKVADVVCVAEFTTAADDSVWIHSLLFHHNYCSIWNPAGFCFQGFASRDIR